MSRKSRERRRLRRQGKPAESADTATTDEREQQEVGRSHAPPPPAEKWGRGMFEDPHHVRADARLAARLISLGVITEEHAEALLRGGFQLAAQAIKDGNGRVYASCMAVPLSVARLEQSERNASRPRLVQHQHAHLHAIRDRVIGTNRVDAETPAVQYEKPEENSAQDTSSDSE